MNKKELIAYLTNVKKRYHTELLNLFGLSEQEYAKNCKEVNSAIDPNSFNIQPNHTITEYFSHYGNDFINGGAIAFKKDELWLLSMLRPRSTYWEIPNESELHYFEIPTAGESYGSKRLTFTSTTGVLAIIAFLAVGVVGGILAGKLLSKSNAGGGGDDPSPTPSPLPEPGKSLDEYTWPEISQISQAGKAKDYFQVGNEKKLQLKHQDTNSNGQIDTGEVYQTVRIIDFDHDVLAADGTTKAGITFEFKDLISDANGFSIATYWNNNVDKTDLLSSINNYTNTTVRKDVDDKGSANTMWFEKSGTSQSLSLANSVIDMLPADLSNNIFSVKKATHCKISGVWTEYSIVDQLFLLSPKEMGYDGSSATPSDAGNMEQSVTTYKFYESATSETDTKRTKQQIKGNDAAALSNCTTFTNQRGYGSTSSYNFAGVHDSTGGYYWLRSPYITGTVAAAWRVVPSGKICGAPEQGTDASVYNDIFSVAPAFCL